MYDRMKRGEINLHDEFQFSRIEHIRFFNYPTNIATNTCDTQMLSVLTEQSLYESKWRTINKPQAIAQEQETE